MKHGPGKVGSARRKGGMNTGKKAMPSNPEAKMPKVMPEQCGPRCKSSIMGIGPKVV